MKCDWTRSGAILVLALSVGAGGCAASWAYRKGQHEAEKGNWDLAVARFTRALQNDPKNIGYKIALENARIQASRQHYVEAKKHLAAEELDQAANELDIAVKYDPSNKSAFDDLEIVRNRIKKREQEKQRLGEFDRLKQRVARNQAKVPTLKDHPEVPITLKYRDQPLQGIFETLGKIVGVNVIFDADYRDKRVSIDLSGVTFQEALDQLTLVNRLFYKVIDQNTLIVVPEQPAARRRYDDAILRTFYLQNAEVNDTVNLVKNLTQLSRVVGNPNLGAITVMGSLDKVAMAERIIENNDKARGEVMVEVEVLSIDRSRAKNYGIDLANYSGTLTLDPLNTGATNGNINVRAQLLSSLNLSDWVVNIPAQLFAQLLQTEDTTRILASPRLRAAEGKKTTLKLVQKIPVPSTQVQIGQSTASAFPVTTVTYADIGVILDLTPKVNANGDISLEINAEFSLQQGDRNVGTTGNPVLVPIFSTRSVNGVLRLQDGQTSLIGGLLQENESTDWKGLMGAKEIPIIGKFLGTNTRKRDDSEIVISITPHVVRAPKVTEEDLTPLYVGSEENPRVPGARPPLLGEPDEAAPSPAPGAAPSPAPNGGSAASSASRGVPPAPLPAAPGVDAKGQPTTPVVGIPAPEATPAPPSPAPNAIPTPTPVSPEPPPSPSPDASPPPLPSSVRFTPPGITARVGDTGALNIMMINAHDVIAVDVTLSFDPSVLDGVDLVSGALLSADGLVPSVEHQNEFGRLRAKFVRPKPTSGSGVIATATLKALKPGLGIVNIDSLVVTTATGTETPVPTGQGRVIITP